MRVLLALMLALVAGHATAGCPYAERAAAPAAGCPYAKQAAKRDVVHAPAHRQAIADKKSIFYMNRIGPSGSTLYIANTDGSDAKELMPNQTNPFDYHASWSPDYQWIVFTSERRALGQSDLYRTKPDGSNLQKLVQTDSVEDVGVLSLDSTLVAYVSTAGNYTANIWVTDLKTGVATDLTDTALTLSSNIYPSGHFRPHSLPTATGLLSARTITRTGVVTATVPAGSTHSL